MCEFARAASLLAYLQYLCSCLDETGKQNHTDKLARDASCNGAHCSAVRVQCGVKNAKSDRGPPGQVCLQQR